MRGVIEALEPRAPLFLGGKSMGARVAAQLADASSVRGVVAVGYPFHPPGRPELLRVAHLATLRTPCLIIQGTRDRFGSPDEVAAYPLSPAVRLHWIEAGDHSLEPPGRSARTLAQNLEDAAREILRFTRQV